ncbi:MAG TPA: hypothetical protein PLO06_11085 [Methanoregulaceae archaeon]|nr:hypothetical protein [Methanoregulaceae archaeon]HPD75555.1 hypothetical protein [Methanoregulaceae archaeon]
MHGVRTPPLKERKTARFAGSRPATRATFLSGDLIDVALISLSSRAKIVRATKKSVDAVVVVDEGCGDANGRIGTMVQVGVVSAVGGTKTSLMYSPGRS